MAARRDLRAGIDVGGTNTDAVILDGQDRILARTKASTTPDVSSGITTALESVLEQIGPDRSRVSRIMLGTTHATNAILERRPLGRVGVLRLAAPATLSIPPMSGWPTDLRDVIAVDSAILPGGNYVDGRIISRVDRDATKRFLESLAGRVDALAVTSVFSPASSDHETEVAALAASILGPDLPVSLAHEVGSLGLLERENATILNAALYGVAGQVVGALDSVLDRLGIDAETLFAQNDGTLMAMEFAQRYPILTIGSGPSNSLRGAAYISGCQSAIVADVGGTSTDLGVLVGGFPRESSEPAEIGGVRTNFRMPDTLAIALGGGTILRRGAGGRPALGPDSVGYRLTSEALAFGGSTVTLTDAGVLHGRLSAGEGADAVRGRLAACADVDATFLAEAPGEAVEMIAGAVDRVSLGRHELPLVAVGGGAFLIPDGVPGVSEVIRPADGAVANAVGAAIAWASGRWDSVVSVGPNFREQVEQARATACERAVAAAADPATVEVVDHVEVPLSYLTTPSVRVMVKAAGPLAST